MPSSDDPGLKAAARHAFRARRRDHVAELGDERGAFEAALVDRLRHWLAPGVIVGGYAARGAEVGLGGIAGLALPRVVDGRLVFHACDAAALVRGFGGIAEPPADAAIVTPGVLLVPLLAVTPAGVRLGQGGGFYDRCLAGLRARGPLVAIGVAWDVQIAARLPEDPWDARLDWVATPTRLVECAGFR